MNKQTKYLILVLLMLLLIMIPESLIFRDHSWCIFKYMTGIKCPLCGMTRASYLMLRLKIASAFTFNPLVIMVPLLMLMEVLNDIINTLLMRQLRKIVWIIFAVGLLVLFILRFFEFFSY